MHRSSSNSRVSEEFFNTTNNNNNNNNNKDTNQTADEAREELLLPTYDPLSHVAKKERSRLRSADNAVHLIPLVLLLCAFILWLFSHPESRV